MMGILAAATDAYDYTVLHCNVASKRFAAGAIHNFSAANQEVINFVHPLMM
jgi:hypothetical protein